MSTEARPEGPTWMPAETEVWARAAPAKLPRSRARSTVRSVLIGLTSAISVRKTRLRSTAIWETARSEPWRGSGYRRGALPSIGGRDSIARPFGGREETDRGLFPERRAARHPGDRAGVRPPRGRSHRR